MEKVHLFPKIIIADDSQNLINTYVKHFHKIHLDVIATFLNGTDVVEYFESGKASKDEKLLLLMEDKLPHLSGIDAARKIRELGFNPIIILTILGPIATPHPEELIDAVLQKPFTVGEFVSLVETLIEANIWPFGLHGSKSHPK